MKKLVWLGALVVACLGTVAVTTTSLAAEVQQSTVLEGTVVEVAPVGALVKEGDPLLSVETIGGPMVAARATVNGVVQTVTVEKGATVTVGQTIGTINDGK